ncbi:hypothetical protein BCR44DRAFT_1479550 [Catenaria anguillulae PL171]|uniref:Alcohol dehydrogenase-like C-terminal domain-containing protein n=1 Tax=Catenaria anguillulae PL171 TaxID=765915 RepID=A0A1Y2HQ60_9FUNG|nr:hypothetical protein BCR44DRAFT_1479550 [Catenaria anguillulae PL171]
MRALVWKGSSSLAVETVDKPELLDEADAIIRITATTICGSDLHLYHNSIPGMKSGDVIVLPIATISLCDNTNPSEEMRALYGGDATAGLFGYSHITGGYKGGQSQYIRVPNAELNTLKSRTIFPMNAWHANEIIHVGPGDKVAIWGCGPIGLCAAMWAKHRGASQIVCIDAIPERLELSLKMGATDVINFKQVDNVCIDCVGFRYAKSVTHGVMKALSMETDACDVVTECVLACKKGGWVGLIGDYVGYTNMFPIGPLMEKSLKMTGGQLFQQQYWQMLLEKITTPGILHVDPAIIFSHRYPLDLAPKAYKAFDNKSALKVLLRPWGTEADSGKGAGHRIVKNEE